jgi:hypothetical protein
MNTQWSDLTVSALKKKCAEHGLPKSGVKVDLLNRLREHDEKFRRSAAPEPPGRHYDHYRPQYDHGEHSSQNVPRMANSMGHPSEAQFNAIKDIQLTIKPTPPVRPRRSLSRSFETTTWLREWSQRTDSKIYHTCWVQSEFRGSQEEAGCNNHKSRDQVQEWHGKVGERQTGEVSTSRGPSFPILWDTFTSSHVSSRHLESVPIVQLAPGHSEIEKCWLKDFLGWTDCTVKLHPSWRSGETGAMHSNNWR